MRHLLAKFWWILALRGIFGILLGLEAFWILSALEWQGEDLFGLYTLLKPGEDWASLIFLLGLYAFWDGLFAAILGAQDYGGGRRWWPLLAEGIFSVGLGAIVWLEPGATFLVLLYWISVWAIMTGFLEMSQGLWGTEYRDRRGPFFYAGLCSVIFGFLVLCPGINGKILAWLIGFYAFFFGIPLLVLGLRLRQFVPAKLRVI